MLINLVGIIVLIAILCIAVLSAIVLVSLTKIDSPRPRDWKKHRPW